jgi:anti-sigma factor RsiW
MTVHDSYTEWDAAYVLGALSAVERREFEDHLTTCDDCRAAVADFAGMPGLLAQLHAGEVLAIDAPSDTRPVETEVLGPVSAVASRRPAWHLPLAVAAAALVVGGMAGYAVSSARSPGTPPSAVAGIVGGRATTRLAFSSVVPSSMTAVVDVHATSTATEFRVECQYAPPATATAPSSKPDYPWVNYAIWVVDRAGRATKLRQWTARPGLIMHPTGVTTVPYAALARVEIRRVDDGQTVMRAQLT